MRPLRYEFRLIGFTARKMLKNPLIWHQRKGNQCCCSEEKATNGISSNQKAILFSEIFRIIKFITSGLDASMGSDQSDFASERAIVKINRWMRKLTKSKDLQSNERRNNWGRPMVDDLIPFDFGSTGADRFVYSFSWDEAVCKTTKRHNFHILFDNFNQPMRIKCDMNVSFSIKIYDCFPFEVDYGVATQLIFIGFPSSQAHFTNDWNEIETPTNSSSTLFRWRCIRKSLMIFHVAATLARTNGCRRLLNEALHRICWLSRSVLKVKSVWWLIGRQCHWAQSRLRKTVSSWPVDCDACGCNGRLSHWRLLTTKQPAKFLEEYFFQRNKPWKMEQFRDIRKKPPW